MPLIFGPTRDKRERIGIMGDGGTGKSKVGLDIVRFTPGHKYVLDVDYTPNWDIVTEEFPELEDKLTVEIVDPDEWKPYSIIEDWRDDATEDDWLIVDSGTPSWTAVQADYSDEMLGKQMAELVSDAREKQLKDKAKSMTVFQGDTDWRVINQRFMRTIWGQLPKWPGHILFTFEEKKLTDDAKREKDWIKGWGHVGYRPEAQKKVTYVFRTNLRMMRQGRDSYVFSTCKDKFREEVEEKEWTNFAKDYLVDVAGWERVKGNAS